MVSSTLSKVLKRSGFIISNNNQNYLTKEQAIFRHEISISINTLLAQNSNVVGEIIESFRNYIDNQKSFYFALSPTVLKCESDSSSSQDSLIKQLLNIDSLQLEVAIVLLEKLAELTINEEEIFEEDGLSENLIHMILKQFRWLDRVLNSKEIVDKMFEIIVVVPIAIQREIICSIPDVLSDDSHDDAAEKLNDLLKSNNQLTNSILEVLSNVNISSELLVQIQDTIISSLDSVNLQTIPSIIKFLLLTVQSKDMNEIIVKLRKNLDLQSLFPSSNNMSKKHHSKESMDEIKSSETLILDSIKSSINFQKNVADAWIKTIDGINEPSEQLHIDFIVLIILHSLNYQNSVETLIRNKIRKGLITDSVVSPTIGKHSQILKDYFPSTLKLAHSFLRSNEQSISFFGSVMYKYAFCSTESYGRQEIIGDLISHIGSGVSHEIDAAFCVLLQLSEKYTEQMVPFSHFVKNVLDFNITRFTMSQIKKLYSTLSCLCLKDEGTLQDDLIIIIKKQLTNNDLRYKRLGVIGALMLIRALARRFSAELCSDSYYQEVVTLLEFVHTSCKSCPYAQALLMDELSLIVGSSQLNYKVEEWISDNVIINFQNDYIVDFKNNLSDSSLILPSKICYGLDGENDESIVLNLFPILLGDPDVVGKISSINLSNKQVSIISMSSCFRLIQLCEKHRNNGNLDGIDAILGCALYFTDIEIVQRIESLSVTQKQVLCMLLFFTINWFREIINAFSTQKDVEIKWKVISRLHTLTELEALVLKVLQAVPNLNLFTVHFDMEERTTSFSLSSKMEKKRKKTTTKGSKKKKTDTSPNKSLALETQKDSGSEADEVNLDFDKANVTTTELNLERFRPYLRELDMDVFGLLKIGVITKKDVDSDDNTEVETTIQLYPLQLKFLLKDLVSKLEYIVSKTTTKRLSFLKVKPIKVGFTNLDNLGAEEVIRRVSLVLPMLCEHLEAASTYFQKQVEANDGVIDGPGSYSDESQLYSSCFNLILKCFVYLFTWNGFSSTANSELLKECLSVLASRLESDWPNETTNDRFLELVFTYIEKFLSFVPTVHSGVTLMQLFVALNALHSSQDINAKIATMSMNLLKRRWIDKDGQLPKGAEFNQQLQILIKLYFSHTDDSLGALNTLSTEAIPEIIKSDAGKNAVSITLPTLSKSTFTVFYRAMFTELVESAKHLNFNSTLSDEDSEAHLLKWSLCIRVLQVLVNLIKIFEGRANIVSALKHSRCFVELFLKLGMPLFDKLFRRHNQEVLNLLKNLQQSTRSLHHICGHSKIIKDVGLINAVPPLKKVLESFVYRVKAMLSVNNCNEAFWLGNLKNRDLKGEEIVSQESQMTLNESNDEDEDRNSDVQSENDSNESETGLQSYSETY